MGRRRAFVRKLTDDVIEKLCIAIKMGNYLDTACAYAGIAKSTFEKWMKLGEEGRGKYAELYERVLEAEREAEWRIVEMWAKHLANDWRACRAFLERRFPERWGDRQRLVHEGGEKPIVIKLVDESAGKEDRDKN